MATSAERRQNLVNEQRLQRELKALKNDPVPGVHATPLPSNMLEWHYVIEGPAGSPYVGGYYHGVIKFPQDYPFKPPSIRMLTPSGRFEPNQRICLSMSDFHPETWNCMWSVSSILQGVVSFMLDSSPAIGTINTSESVKKQLARTSMSTNCQNKQFRELFEDLVAKWENENPQSCLQQAEDAQQNAPASNSHDVSLSGAVLPLAAVLVVRTPRTSIHAVDKKAVLGVLIWLVFYQSASVDL